ncbi:hypothetical protein [Planktothrix sp. PCC 11201]|uniref:hypothetical protein n=1 Tax=Planktothrix sp. PCC 11201 TaxID=1729650 RepID=UPI0009A84122|nr:hypothetical protein [Planktothrix sp. PCC 11201]
MDYPKLKNHKFNSGLIVGSIILTLPVIVTLFFISGTMCKNYFQGKPEELTKSVGSGLGLYVVIVVAVLGGNNFFIDLKIKASENDIRDKLRQSFKQEQNFNNAPSDLVERAKEALINYKNNQNVSESDKGDMLALINQLDALQKRQPSYQTVKHWLEDEENLKSLAVKSGDSVLEDYPFGGLEIINKTTAKSDLDNGIWNCLEWIRESFNKGIYLTRKLPPISDKKRTIAALNWINTKALLEEKFLDQPGRDLLAIYFNKLAKILDQKSK